MGKKKVARWKKILIVLCLFCGVIFISFGLVSAYFYNKYDLDINKLTSLNNGIKVYSASMTETTLYNTNRSIVDIDNLPNYVIKAFVDTEDKRFFKHKGYDIKRIAKAFMVNLAMKSKSQGASTISQQLVKNALLTNEKTLNRKIKEIVLSIKMEKKFSKKEILEMYLNTIYFGANAYGIENASQAYFNKSAKDLTLNEVCCLAGIIKSPSYYSPTKSMDNAVKRRNVVAKALLSSKDISNEEYNEIINSPIKLSATNFEHSYEKEAIYEACQLLNITERELINKKYELVTFKNDETQNMVIVANNDTIGSSEKQQNYDLDGLSIVLNNDGKVEAFYANSMYNLHNLVRQPASTLKPLVVYLPCIIDNILTPSTKILDEPIDFNGYSPKNADNKFYGYISARDALKNSLNVPAVKLLDCVGLKKAGEILCQLGINLDKADYNLSTALGSLKKGIKLTDLVSAYSTIANLGQYNGFNFVDKILDENGKVIYQYQPYSQTVLSKEDCFLLTDMLKDCTNSGTAKRLAELNLPIASKTGTAFNGTDNTDIYNIAYTPNHTVLTWIGSIKTNKLPSELKSSNEPTQINKDILKSLYQGKAVADFIKPEGVEKMPFDAIEYDENNIIVQPSSALERFKKYDYFKLSNPPKENFNVGSNFCVELDKYGAKISFNAVKSKAYEVIKEVNSNRTLFEKISEKSGKIELVDNDVFSFEEVKYTLKTDGEEKSFTLRPKDFLVNLLNNEIILGKKKWYV